MDDRHLGLAIRALRVRRRWRQEDLARAALTSQPQISRLEAGTIEEVTLAVLRRVLAALDASLVLSPSWRGAALDRLLDERHASLVETAVLLLRRAGWETEIEASFSRYGERGSIDILGVHQAAHAAVMVEVKSELVAIEGTLRPMDVKTRLTSSIVFERFGWRPILVGRLLVLPETSTARREVRRHEETLRSALPVRGAAATRWLRYPGGSFGGLVFLSPIRGTDGKGNLSVARRVRRRPAGRPERGTRWVQTESGFDGHSPSAGRMDDEDLPGQRR